jgi:dolichol kinase
MTFAASFVAGLAIAYVISEYFRLRGRSIPVLAAITKMAMRQGDEKKGTFVIAPLYFAAGILASLLVFPEPLNHAAIAVVTLGDGAASVAGRLYGRHKIAGGKTIEGTAAGLLCAFAGAALFVTPTTALAAAAIGMAVELLPLRVSDNLTVPLLAGLAATLAGNL